MNVIRLLPALLASLLLAAHYFRAGDNALVIVCLLSPFLLLLKKRWVIYSCTGLLIIAALIWMNSIFAIMQIRMALGVPYLRMMIILGAVALFTGLSTLAFKNKKLLERYRGAVETSAASAAVFLLTGILLGIAHIKVSIPIMLLERFIPGGGWIEILLLAVYAAWITEKMLDRSITAKWRRRIWLFFSIIFFSQFVLGLIGFEIFLMTGKLHIPVPAIIIAGPIFRWEISIMLFLFAGSILAVGPAWCSHLCYVGAWDNAASQMRKKPQPMPKWARHGRLLILILVIMTAVMLRLSGLPTLAATTLGIAFGLIGVGLMAFWSRKQGAMTHCVAYCPIGFLAVWLGKISPFRLKINGSCTDCGVCRLACRYDALNLQDIKNRKPGINCTLCGDCIGTCDDRSIEYKFFGLKADSARTFFIIMAVTLHTIFLGLGRL